jgi:predicted dehydrogenase
VRVGLAGLGKMGISHQAILNAHPQVELAAVCDTTGYVLDVMGKYTGVKTYSDYDKMLSLEALEAVVIATPSSFHAGMVEKALSRGLHVFCEKPFSLDVAAGERLAAQAEAAGLVNQVGYHYRFVAAFAHLKQLVEQGVLGRIHHIRAEAHGPVVLRSKGSSWRSAKSAGGGALYDYASHAVDLVNFCFGRPDFVGGAVVAPVFSSEVDDEVYATLGYGDGKSVQLSVNWSDDSQRKMSTRLTVWGSNGKIVADRQEIQLFLRDASLATGFQQGWNVRYTTELTEPVDYYLRGEEYSAQIDHFVASILAGDPATRSTFRSAAETDRVIEAIRSNAQHPRTTIDDGAAMREQAPARGTLARMLRGTRTTKGRR